MMEGCYISTKNRSQAHTKNDTQKQN